MATHQDFLRYMLEQLDSVSGLTYKKMMGEYLLYKDGVLFGGIYDNRFLIKKTKSLENYGLKEVIPYPHAKPMLLVESEDTQEIKALIFLCINNLKKSS